MKHDYANRDRAQFIRNVERMASYADKRSLHLALIERYRLLDVTHKYLLKKKLEESDWDCRMRLLKEEGEV